MRIVLVNWAHIWDGANKGGGVNGYCQSLGLELVARGHEVVYLSSGVNFWPGPDGQGVGACEVRRYPDWSGIRVFEVINSPVVAPALEQFKNPEAETSSPELERVVGDLFRLIRPDVVHFHNIEGMSAGCIEEARRAGAAVLYSLHNYHTVCPQTYLMRGYRRPCFGSSNGAACAGCVDGPDPAQRRAQRAQHLAGSMNGHAGAAAATNGTNGVAHDDKTRDGRPVLQQLMVELKSLIKPREVVAVAPEAAKPLAPPASMPGRGVTDESSAMGVFIPEGYDWRGYVPHHLEGVPWQSRGPDHPDWQPLDNITDDHSDDGTPPNEYGQRRAAMVAALNRCDRVLAVSEFVRGKFEAMGVSRDVLMTQHIGSKVSRLAQESPGLVFDPPPFDGLGGRRLIRLVFMGFNTYYKGLEMLAESLDLMKPEDLGRFHLYVYAQEGQSMEWWFRRLEPRLGGLTIQHGYRYKDIPWMLGGKDAGIVPSVWWDNAPQTVFEYLACGVPVLGARLGGIPDFVKDGENGLLFRGNDRFDLARTLAEIARRPERLAELRRNVRPPKDITEHAVELEQLYEKCLCSADRSANFSRG